MGNHIGAINCKSRQITTSNIGMLHFQIRGLEHYISKTKSQLLHLNMVKRQVLTIGKHWKNDHDLLTGWSGSIFT